MKVSGWQNVRRLMLDGWHLGFSGGMEGDWWLQKGGLGKGGESRPVHASTGFKMQQGNLITAVNSEDTPWYRTDYVLTESIEANK